MKTFTDVLHDFKVSEEMHPLSILERDVDLQAVIAAWSPDVAEIHDTGGSPPDGAGERDLWGWLWDQTSVDENALMSRSSLMNVRPKLSQAIALRFVYPDGTIHKGAKGMLAAIVTERLQPGRFGRRAPGRS